MTRGGYDSGIASHMYEGLAALEMLLIFTESKYLTTYAFKKKSKDPMLTNPLAGLTCVGPMVPGRLNFSREQLLVYMIAFIQFLFYGTSA